MVLTRDGVLRLLKEALWNKANSNQTGYEIYDKVYDIMHNGTENGLELEDCDFERAADDILHEYGTEVDDNLVPMTLEDIERELGYKVKII